MSWAEDTKFRLQIAALGLTVLCPIFLIMDAGVNRQRLASRNWPSTPGEIRDVIAKPSFDSDSRKMKFYGRAVYDYRVEGQEYTSDLTDLGPGTKRVDPQTALADMEQYHAGMKVTVYYDPNNPGIGILETGIPPLQLGLLVVLCILTVICGISSFFILRGWIRSLKMASAKKPPLPNRPATAMSGDASNTSQELAEGGAPATATQADTDRLGGIFDEFEPNRTNLIAGVILALAMIVGGISLALLLHFREDPKPLGTGDAIAKYLIEAALGFGLPAGGIALLVWVVRLFSYRVLVGEGGLACVRRGRTEFCFWEQTEEIRQVLTEEELKILKVPGASLKNIAQHLVVRRRDGQVFSFSVNTVKGLSRLTELLKEMSQRHNIPWRTEEP